MEEAAKTSEADLKTQDDVTNVRRSGKKVTYETDSFNGLQRGEIRESMESMYN